MARRAERMNPSVIREMGSSSKVLAPGLRLGYLIAPKAVYPKLLQARQAADLHTPGFNQRLVSPHHRCRSNAASNSWPRL
jgi:DNA-binding transcriptional MocR family regulator